MSECVSETLLLGIHRSRWCEAVSSKWWSKWHLVCRNNVYFWDFIFSLATYRTTPRIQFYFIT